MQEMSEILQQTFVQIGVHNHKVYLLMISFLICACSTAQSITVYFILQIQQTDGVVTLAQVHFYLVTMTLKLASNNVLILIHMPMPIIQIASVYRTVPILLIFITEIIIQRHVLWQ